MGRRFKLGVGVLGSIRGNMSFFSPIIVLVACSPGVMFPDSILIYEICLRVGPSVGVRKRGLKVETCAVTYSIARSIPFILSCAKVDCGRIIPPF